MSESVELDSGEREQGELEWHVLQPADARQKLKAEAPLSDDEVRHRMANHGPNALPEARVGGAWARLGRQLKNFLIYVLAAAAVITASLGHWVDAGVILAVVVIQTPVGFIQEGKIDE